GAWSKNVVELRGYLAADLPDYMVPAYFVVMEKMPLNPNGKVDRKALPEPDRTAGGDYVPPRDEKEKILVNIWSELLGVDCGRIGIHDNFFQLGGHSLKAAGLVGRIHKAFSVEIPIAELFQAPTIKGVSDYMEKTRESIYSSLTPVEKRAYYALSSVQERLFFIHQVAPSAVTYNLPAVMKLEGSVDRERFERAFKQLIRRHESLRTSFEIIGAEPVQIIHKSVEFEIEHYDFTGEGETGDLSRVVRPFELSLPPLLRVGLGEIREDGYLLVVDMHHIISDGVSMGIFIKEFTALYCLEPLPGLQLQYKDFSHWQNNLAASGEFKAQEIFWQEQFKGEIPVLNLPTDYPRSSVQQFTGSRIDFEIGSGETAGLKQLALESGSTLYMVLFALFNLFLSKLSSQEDIVVGTAAAGRRRHDLKDIIGMFVNILALRTDTSGLKAFPDFLLEVKDNLLAAFENQDYQYEELVETLEIERDLSRNPLFDTLFV
ncbi:MAG: non-ribosomal peptide synthetase, partial [bacterium]|nr:non-ribosomal peptide synthetase [bacterium]